MIHTCIRIRGCLFVKSMLPNGLFAFREVARVIGLIKQESREFWRNENERENECELMNWFLGNQIDFVFIIDSWYPTTLSLPPTLVHSFVFYSCLIVHTNVVLLAVFSLFYLIVSLNKSFYEQCFRNTKRINPFHHSLSLFVERKLYRQYQSEQCYRITLKKKVTISL